jgi:hypothetical protein
MHLKKNKLQKHTKKKNIYKIDFHAQEYPNFYCLDYIRLPSRTNPSFGKSKTRYQYLRHLFAVNIHWKAVKITEHGFISI